MPKKMTDEEILEGRKHLEEEKRRKEEAKSNLLETILEFIDFSTTKDLVSQTVIFDNRVEEFNKFFEKHFPEDKDDIYNRYKEVGGAEGFHYIYRQYRVRKRRLRELRIEAIVDLVQQLSEKIDNGQKLDEYTYDFLDFKGDVKEKLNRLREVSKKYGITTLRDSQKELNLII